MPAATPAQNKNEGATKPFKKSSDRNAAPARKPGASRAFVTCTSIITSTASPRNRSK